MTLRPSDARRRQILDDARSLGHVQVSALAGRLHIAPETVRRDLAILEEHGLVRRTHGGAYPVESAGYETNIERRAGSLVAEKQRIAAAALPLLKDAETVYIDEGYTPQRVAEQLVRVDRPLRVVTNSLASAQILAKSPSITVIMLGGRVRGQTMATVDHWATAVLADLVIDLAFLGANGITRDRGLTTPDPAVAAVKSTVVACSRRRVFVGAHIKFGAISFCRFAKVADFEALITDSALSVHEARRYTALGPEVIRA